ncbi:MAG: CPBP family intramembrane metalloprotease [Chloroflexi bacterium]|nr:CPBP family intramembrane metalloprotease [Chloroflexota bacterium]
MKLKSLAPLMAYVTVAAGLFWARSAWGALLGFHIGLLSILFIERPPLLFGALFKGFHPALLIGCVLLSASSGLTLYFGWPIFSISPNLAADLASIGLTPAVWSAFIAYFALVNPWIEEYFWRGYLGDPSSKILPVDFYFAGYHLLILFGRTNWAWMLVSLLTLAGVAWLWRQVYRKTGGLLIPLLAHMAADLSILTAVYLMCK